MDTGKSLQKMIGLPYSLRHGIVVLSESTDRIKLAMEETSPVIMDEVRKMMPRGKEAVFFRADRHKNEEVMKKLSDPFGIIRYCESK